MNDDEVDDIAFLTGDSRIGMSKRVLYEPSGVADRVRRIVLTPRKACCIAVGCFVAILSIALIAAFARPYLSCDCSLEKSSTGEEDGTLHIPDYGHVTPNGEEHKPAPTSPPPLATNGELFPWTDLRLPHFIEAFHYSVFMHPNLTKFTFVGAINITFKVNVSQNFLVLHSKNLDLQDIQLLNISTIRVQKWLLYVRHEQLYIEFNEKLDPDRMYCISITFNGTLAERLEGFYLSSYTNSAGGKKYLATTHFEPTYARTAFPCFDEPSYKATFVMSIVRDASHISLFNSPTLQTENYDSDLLIDTFQKTVKMSTYLVAFVVCDYKNVTKMADMQVKVSVYSPPDQISQANIALDVAVNILNYYNIFFGIAYPLPKQDLISIPDFGAGAMENWGLTMYRDSTILADMKETSDIRQQGVTVTIAHELAHQWFGNLVTMKWWNDLWLNEGFASYMENLGTDHIHPEWKMMEQFILEKTQPALTLDSLPSSHPISVKVGDPAEIESIFDSISYSKGASIINMLENFLGMDTLQNGLKTYLSSFKYSNAETEDLWQVLSQESKLINLSVDVKDVMDTWTQQMGFPLIKIQKKGNEIYAFQERFLLGSSIEDDIVSSEYISKYGYKWYVPLTYITDQQPQVSNLVWMKMEDVKFSVPNDVQWIKFNINQTGFYRVMYDDEMWRQLITALKKNHTVFSPADKSSLIDDAFTLSLNRMLDPTIPLELAQYLVHERDYVPWITALEHLAKLEALLWDKPSYPLLTKFVRETLIPITDHLGWEETGSHLERFLRPNILLEAIHRKNDTIINEAKQRFQDWKTKNVSIPPALREVVYTAGITYGTYEDWKRCWDLYTTTQLSSEISTLQTALAASRDPWILSQYLEYSLQRDKVRPQNTYVVLRSVYLNPIGRDMTWRFVRSNWNTLVEMFGIGSFTMANIISDVTSRFTTRFDYQEVQSFFENHDTGSGKRAVKTSLEKISSYSDWLEKNEKFVEEWLKTKVINTN